MGEADDRPPGPQTGDRRRCSAGEGRDEDRAGSERLGDVAGGVRHRLADRRLLVGRGDLVAVVEARFDGARDPVHELHCLTGVLADRGLAGEHDRGGAVEDGVRDVRGLGPCRLRLVDHRLEHLRRGDHRLAALERLEDDPLLEQRHLGRADLDAQVATSDHHRVRLDQDVVEHGHRLGLLDLRDHLAGRARRLDQSSERAHVGRGANE